VHIEAYARETIRTPAAAIDILTPDRHCLLAKSAILGASPLKMGLFTAAHGMSNGSATKKRATTGRSL